MSTGRGPAVVPFFTGPALRRYVPSAPPVPVAAGTDAILDESGAVITDEAGNPIEDEAGP